jgi:hypothetical protein
MVDDSFKEFALDPLSVLLPDVWLAAQAIGI